MYQFDVTYTFDNYYEYYKDALVKQRIVKDMVFSVLFIAFGVYYLIAYHAQEGFNYLLPILSFAMGLIFPLLNIFTLPMLKKQLRGRQADIDKTHIFVTFNSDEVVYENKTPKPEVPVEEKKEEPVAEPAKEETPVEEVKAEETPAEEVKAEEVVAEEPAQEEAPAEEKKESNDIAPEEAKDAGQKDENTFILKYSNFMLVKELENIFLFYLDRQTVIILPKEKMLYSTDYTAFKDFIRSKVNPKFIRFKKEKNLEK